MSGTYGMEYGGGDPMAMSNRTSMGSNTGSSSGRRNYDEQNLIPATIRMILHSTPGIDDGSLVLPDNRELHQVKIVGAVRGVEEQSTNVTFQVEDGTGLIEVKQWVGPEDVSGVTEMRMDAMQCNSYVRVIGQVKDYEGKKSIIGYNVRKVSTGNELTHHMLEVVYAHERHKNGGAAGMGGKQPQGVTPYSLPSGGMQGNSFNANNNMGQAMQAPEGAPRAYEDVRQFIKQEGDKNDMGADIGECMKYFSGRYNHREISDAVSALSSDGHIYSTIDENKYKCAE